MGASGMRCITCHGAANFERVPGNPKWMLAPKEMAWIGRSLGEICEQIKDPKRNGGKKLDEIVQKLRVDSHDDGEQRLVVGATARLSRAAYRG